MNDQLVKDFMELFHGRTDAFGTGQGQWVKRTPTFYDFSMHLQGAETGIGIAPLQDDGTVRFAAIDLDEPDFDAAFEMQKYLPGVTWVERSRSGNAHIWVFFSDPIDAWIPRGILKYATEAIGKGAVEVFPKQDRLLEGMFGNYINLPYHGTERPIIKPDGHTMTLSHFIYGAGSTVNDPEDWTKRANWLEIPSPENRPDRTNEFGTMPYLHICAEHIIANREQNPVTEGHRNVVLFNLTRMLLNYEGFDTDEARYYVNLVNDASPDPLQQFEIERMIRNAERGRFTGTGCDDALMHPYVHPDCPIAHG